MMFKESLEGILERTNGSLGALIMGRDGISVEKVLNEQGRQINLDIAAAEYTSLVRSAQRSGVDTGLGGLQELVVALDNATLLIRLLNQDYFLILALSPDGNVGRGRFELRKAELNLAREFVV